MATKAKEPATKKPAARKRVNPASPSSAPSAPKADARRAATIVAAGALRAALKDVLGAIEARNTIPVLANVLMRAEGRSLALGGTNLDMWITRTIAADPEADWRGFATTVQAKTLERILAELPAEAMVTLEKPIDADTARFVVTAGRARFLLPQLPPDDLPEPGPFVGGAGFDIGCGALGDLLASVEHAISDEETRYYLNGVFVHPWPAEEPSHLRLAATDGHRLARAQVGLPDGADAFPPAIWPSKAVALLGRLLAAGAKTGTKDDPAMALVEANRAGTVLRFALPGADGGEALLTVKAIDGSFPDYVRVVPTAPGQRAVINRELLATATRRAAAMVSEKTRAVKLTFAEGRVSAATSNPDTGEGRDEEPCLFEGPETTIGVNAAFLLQALAAFATDEIAVGFDDPAAPLLLRAVGRDEDGEADRDRLLQVLMPMRV